MAFTNDAEFMDDFRTVGADVTAGFEPAGSASDPTAHAGSANVEVAGQAAGPDADDEEDLDEEDDEDLEDDEDVEGDDDLEDEDDEEVDDADDLEEDDDDLDEDDDEEDDDEIEEEDDDTVRARNTAAASVARAR